MNAAAAWVALSWVLLIGTAVLWPVSAATFASSEPQTVLHLSWLAIFVSALGNLVTAKVNRKVES